jgi:hypothetical protein
MTGYARPIAVRSAGPRRARCDWRSRSTSVPACAIGGANPSCCVIASVCEGLRTFRSR